MRDKNRRIQFLGETHLSVTTKLFLKFNNWYTFLEVLSFNFSRLTRHQFCLIKKNYSYTTALSTKYS